MLFCGTIMPVQNLWVFKIMNNQKYWKELFIIILIKSVLLTGIWYTFFKDKEIIVDKQVLENHLLR